MKQINVKTKAAVGDIVYIIVTNRYQLKAACPVCGGKKNIFTIAGNSVPCCPEGQVVYTATRYYYVRQEISDMKILELGSTYNQRVMVTTGPFKKLGIWFHPDNIIVVDKDNDERGMCGRNLLRDADRCREYFIHSVEAITEGRGHIVCLTEDRAAHICRTMMEYEKEKLEEHNMLSGTSFVWPWDRDIKAYEEIDSHEFEGISRKFKKVEAKTMTVCTPVASGDPLFRIVFNEDKEWVVQRNGAYVTIKMNYETADIEISYGSDTMKAYILDPSTEYIRSTDPMEYKIWLFTEPADAAFARDIINGRDCRTIELRF